MLCCLSFEGSVFHHVSKNTIVRTTFSFFFFSLFFFRFSFFSLCEHVLRVFVVSSFHPRGRRHRSFLTDRSTGRFPGAASPISSEQYTWENPVSRCRESYPGERRSGTAETGNTLYAVCARRDRFADTLYREPAIAFGSHPRVYVNLHPGSGSSSRGKKTGFIFVRSLFLFKFV